MNQVASFASSLQVLSACTTASALTSPSIPWLCSIYHPVDLHHMLLAVTSCKQMLEYKLSVKNGKPTPNVTSRLELPKTSM